MQYVALWIQITSAWMAFHKDHNLHVFLETIIVRIFIEICMPTLKRRTCKWWKRKYCLKKSKRSKWGNRIKAVNTTRSKEARFINIMQTQKRKEHICSRLKKCWTRAYRSMTIDCYLAWARSKVWLNKMKTAVPRLQIPVTCATRNTMTKILRHFKIHRRKINHLIDKFLIKWRKWQNRRMPFNKPEKQKSSLKRQE